MKYYCLIVLTFMLYGCTQNSSKVASATSDSNTIVNSQINKKQTHTWTNESEFYGVYQFSEKVIGIGFGIDDSPIKQTILDSLYNVGLSKVGAKGDDKVVDSTGQFNISFSEKLSRVIVQNDISRVFFIYCEKGLTTASIKKVLYISDDCNKYLILQLSDIDEKTFGHPIIASKTKLDLTYKVNAVLQEKLKTYQREAEKKADYKDNIQAKQFSFDKNRLLAYSDDFLWYKKKGASKCLFPARYVLNYSTPVVTVNWMNCLDLFGIPCD